MNSQRFLWRPTWVHLEQPLFGGYGLPRLRWLIWVPDDRTLEERLEAKRRNAIGDGVFAIGAALTAFILMVSGFRY